MSTVASLAFERFRGTRPLIIETDAMAPTLRARRHVAMLAPVHGYAGEGLYAIAGYHDCIEVYRAVMVPPGRQIRMLRDNATFEQDWRPNIAEFESLVLGKIVGVIEFFDCDAYAAFVADLVI
jgi:hypothetical protein